MQTRFGSLLTNVVAARLLGKPMTISEFDNYSPAPTRSGLSLVVGAQAGLQGLSGVYRYAFTQHRYDFFGLAASSDQSTPHWEGEYTGLRLAAIAAEPAVALSERIGSMLFAQGAVSPSAIKIGPHKDIVGIWGEIARRQGLRFGVSVHAARAWDWFQVAFGSDKQGPLAGVPYDGHLTKADGHGQWWEGLDPADLYVRSHAKGEKRDPAYLDKFFNRTKELMDRYRPDLVYFDDRELPLGEVGLHLAAHLYNTSAAAHNGYPDAVINGKYLSSEKRHALVEDFERGYGDGLKERPWQTCTCIGEWHHRRGIKYKSVGQVVRTLVDVVSKNGNLLLSIPLRGDGTVDDDEVAFLKGMEDWIKINGQAIYGTRPWKIYGEGPAHAPGARFNEASIAFDDKDIRFTTKDGILFAFVLGWPENRNVAIASLGKGAAMLNAGQTISKISLLGHLEPLKWVQDVKGLSISLPDRPPCEHAYAFQIEFSPAGSP